MLLQVTTFCNNSNASALANLPYKTKLSKDVLLATTEQEMSREQSQVYIRFRELKW
jgi:hypothetical protein